MEAIIGYLLLCWQILAKCNSLVVTLQTISRETKILLDANLCVVVVVRLCVGWGFERHNEIRISFMVV